MENLVGDAPRSSMLLVLARLVAGLTTMVGTGLVSGLTTVTGLDGFWASAFSIGAETIVRAASATGARTVREGRAVSLGMMTPLLESSANRIRLMGGTP